MPYILDLEKLQPGDIILESGSTKFSPLIKTATFSKYSHAMIYVGNSIIHAEPDGVYSKNPQRIIVEDAGKLKVLRPKNKLTEKSKLIITTFARNLSGSLYSIPEAGASQILHRTKEEAKTSDQFCSRLVAQAYIQSGIRIVNNPDYCSPADISNSKTLIEVSGCIRKASESEIHFANSEDPVKENQKRMFEWLNKARDIFKPLNITIQTESDVGDNLTKHQHLDKEISKHIKESGYLEHYDYDKKANPHRYDINLFIDKARKHQNPLDVFFGEINKEPNEISRHYQSYFSSGLNHVHLNLEYHLLNKQLYRNLLSMSRDRLLVLSKFSKIIGEQKLQDICSYLISNVEKMI